MDYFELYEIPVSLKIDKNLIQKKYYSLCKQFHPDHFTLADTESQNTAEAMLTNINSAKVVLENAYKRLEYILKQKNIILTDEKYTLSPFFLGEMMDINEQLMELEFENNSAITDSIKKSIEQQEATLYKSVSHFFEQEKLEASPEEFEILKEYYYQKKYINRIIEKLN